MTEVIRSTADGTVRLMQTESGTFEVWSGDVCVARTSVRAVALDEFALARDERAVTAREKASKERSHYEMQAVRSESFERRAANARKRGGPGGRGGV
jgi:hypothetical protein